MASAGFNIEEAIGFLMNRSGRLMGRQLSKSFVEHGIGIHGEQWPVLLQLWIKDGRYQKELAEFSCRDKGTITRVVAGLEKDNVVLRVADEKDKRHNKVFLTHKGKELKEKTLPLAFELSQKALDGIEEKDIEICKNVLRKIFENLSK